jgi:hypothetical protein
MTGAKLRKEYAKLVFAPYDIMTLIENLKEVAEASGLDLARLISPKDKGSGNIAPETMRFLQNALQKLMQDKDARNDLNSTFVNDWDKQNSGGDARPKKISEPISSKQAKPTELTFYLSGDSQVGEPTVTQERPFFSPNGLRDGQSQTAGRAPNARLNYTREKGSKQTELNMFPK